MAPHTELACIHLCSGYGGFELGLRLAGINARTVAHVERDTYAAATLVARMEETHLDQAPIWDDLTTFDGTAWRGKVDCITAGFPCQPFSAAGNRLGVDDHRWLWPAIKRIICDVGPAYVFLENVPQLVRGGLPFVLSDLAELGFNAEWGLHSAAEVGAPHKRERFWLLAHTTGIDEREQDHTQRTVTRCSSRRNAGGNGEQLGNTTGGEPAKGISAPWLRGNPDGDGVRAQPDPTMADTNSARPKRHGVTTNSQTAPLTRATSDSRSTWPPTRDGNWDEYIKQGGPKPALRRTTDGPTQGLADTLHLGGNGLVPAVAAAAFIELLNRHQH